MSASYTIEIKTAGRADDPIRLKSEARNDCARLFALLVGRPHGKVPPSIGKVLVVGVRYWRDGSDHDLAQWGA